MAVFLFKAAASKQLKMNNLTDQDLDATIKTLQAIRQDYAAFNDLTATNRKFGQIFGIIKTIQQSVEKSFQMKHIQKLAKALDDRLLKKTGIVTLREFRKENSVTDYCGSSMPIEIPPDNYKSVTEGLDEFSAGTIELHNNHSRVPTAVNEKKFEELDQLRKEFNLKDTLLFGKNCHICNQTFGKIHFFYDQLCPSCSALNYEKRNEIIDLSGKTAIVTGGRVKIGYCVVLKLLRCGATVLTTTRFPNDAAKRFKNEPDYLDFKSRLRIVGLDFRDIPRVHYFCSYIKSVFKSLDILINNAAQTVRKPPCFYEHLVNDELNSEHHDLVVDQFGYQLVDTHPAASSTGEIITQEKELQQAKKMKTIPFGSVQLSQIPLIKSDLVSASEKQKSFPPGLYDLDHQQVDLRTENSWTLKLSQISTVEMIECHAINSFSPFIINSELKPLLMIQTPETEKDRIKHGRYIVNVSAMEGQFYRHKTANHPHTNMAKASLNMLTRTSAQDYCTDGIYMNSVDTGWITDEAPGGGQSKMYTTCPLDEWDAAARILDPVFQGIKGQKSFGLFYKNFFPTKW